MNFFHRAIISSKKNPIKSLLFFIILLVISLTVFSLLLAMSSISTSVDSIRTSIPIVTTARRTHINQEQILDSIAIRTIGDLPNVINYNYSIPSGVFSRLRDYSPESNFSNIISSNDFEGMNSFFWLNGVSHTNIINIDYGLFSLSDGRIFTQNELDYKDLNQPIPVLITSQIADINNLDVGSVINIFKDIVDFPEEITFEIYKQLAFEEQIALYWDYTILEQYEVQIIGLLDLNLDEIIDFETYAMHRVIYNTMFVPNWFTQKLYNQTLVSNEFSHRLEYYNSGWVYQELINVFWTLDNLDALAEFTKSANEILPDGFIIEDWVNTFLPLENAMNQVNNISQQFLIFILIASVIIITLTILLFYHDRRHELGVYVALGEKKLKIIAQLMFEIVFISFTAIIFSFLIGIQVSTHFTNNLLLTELNREFEEMQHESWVWSEEQGRFVMQEVFPSQLEFHGISRDLTIYELQDLFSISMTTRPVINSFFIITTTIIISSVVPLLYVLEISPKKLLMQSRIS